MHPRRTMAVVRPWAPNFSEMAMYKPALREFEVTYFYSGPTLDVGRRELAALGLEGMRVRRYRSINDLLPLRPVRRALDLTMGVGSWMLTGLQEACQHDVINIVDPIYTFSGQIVRRLSRQQKVIVVCWETIPNRYDRVVRARARADRVLSRADGIICTSMAARESLSIRGSLDRVAPKVRVIYPGIVLPLPPSEPSETSPPSIITVARLQWQKGVDDLIAAVAILQRSYLSQVRLLVIGDGDAAPWRALSEIYGVGHAVEFLGSLPNVEVRRRISEASVYCQASAVSRTWCEQFGFAVVEAMALARPVVAACSGVLPEILGKDGVYCAVRNAHDLARALMQVLSDRRAARIRGERLAERARERYDADRQGAFLLEMIRAL